MTVQAFWKATKVDQWETASTPVVRIFREAISREQADAYLVLLAGANHFSVVDRLDPNFASYWFRFSSHSTANSNSLSYSRDSWVVYRSSCPSTIKSILPT